ncbi:hypothetical protein [Nostoc sp. MS1]|uniref:hypothetical protein n=1 Tax=Nostoc sp. MS1 TaxID=2764711 RepID=UPI001CC4B9FE|nr:hypothetical protein [Nostoc sp. MS1]BCL39842.1 hypothetical protein NSMS1_62890 [Nostoc sp. MS1]
MTEPIMLFLDINGVIELQEEGKSPEQIYKRETGTPTPGAKEFLQVIDNCPWIHPVWISSWGWSSQAWNKWSQTRLWDVAYSCDKDEKKAHKLFPGASSKYLDVRWYSRDWQYRIVWIEDLFGLTNDTLSWTQNNSKVKIIDTAGTPKQWRKGHKKGIRYWNIEQICDTLDIHGANREVLLNHIKYPFVDSTEVKTENITTDLSDSKGLISSQILASTTNSTVKLGEKISFLDEEIEKDQGLVISAVRKLLKLFQNAKK